MKKITIGAIILTLTVISGCSFTKVRNTDTPIQTDQPIVSGTAQTQTSAVETTGEAEVVEIDTTGTLPTLDTTTTTPEPTSEEKALQDRIQKLIEERKIQSKNNTGLTEEDIQLMEDILEEIVNGTD